MSQLALRKPHSRFGSQPAPQHARSAVQPWPRAGAAKCKSSLWGSPARCSPHRDTVQQRCCCAGRGATPLCHRGSTAAAWLCPPPPPHAAPLHPASTATATATAARFSFHASRAGRPARHACAASESTRDAAPQPPNPSPSPSYPTPAQPPAAGAEGHAGADAALQTALGCLSATRSYASLTSLLAGEPSADGGGGGGCSSSVAEALSQPAVSPLILMQVSARRRTAQTAPAGLSAHAHAHAHADPGAAGHAAGHAI